MKPDDLDTLYWKNIRPHTYTTQINDIVIYVEKLIDIDADYNYRYIIVDNKNTRSINEIIPGTHRHGVYTNLSATKEAAKVHIVDTINKITKYAKEQLFIKNSKQLPEWP